MPDLTPPSTHELSEARTAVASSGDTAQPAVRVGTASSPHAGASLFDQWAPLHSKIFLALLVACCLLPFIGKAFNMDDTAYVWQAQQIAKHPLDPYGFSSNWDATQHPFWQNDQNPPLIAYYGALVGRVAGWSEEALHFAFLLPAVVFALATYQLARRFTKFPLIAAAAAFLCPGVIVSSTTIMTDTSMVAIFVLAAIFWIEGIDSEKPLYLFLGVALMAACGLTKYFGMSLVPLAFVYGIARKRRVGVWALYLLLPIAVMAGYEYWTHAIYGRGLIWDAFHQAADQRAHGIVPKLKNLLISMSFAGGAMLSVLVLAPLLWSRKQLAGGALLTGLFAAILHFGVIDLGLPADADRHWMLSLQLAIFVAGGFSILVLLLADILRQKSVDSAFLALWILGTIAFVAVLNWTVNVRTLLPLIPAAGVLIARRLERRNDAPAQSLFAKFAIPLALSGALSLWIAGADTGLANSARSATNAIMQLTQDTGASTFFEGHWGFQYYMEASGAHPIDLVAKDYRAGDFVAMPENNSNVFGLLPGFRPADGRVIYMNVPKWITIINLKSGAGFYSSLWGPLPFAFGPAASERYFLIRLAPEAPLAGVQSPQ